MGRGDRRTRKGKINVASYGNSRPTAKRRRNRAKALKAGKKTK